MIKRIKENKEKGFTIIELIVVIAVLGILVLLAMYGFSGQTEKARVAQITNDVKVAENSSAVHLIENSEFPSSWHNADMRALSSALDSGGLYSTEGIVDEVEPGPYKIIGEDFVKNEIRSNLDGDFFVNEGGKVYYQDDNAEGIPELEEPVNYEKPDEMEFVWIQEEGAPLSEFRGEEGYYQYRGDKEYIVIPEVVQGERLTNYYKMFSVGSSTTVKGVASDSKNVNYMGQMFDNFPGSKLDIRHLRTQDADSIYKMFANTNLNELDIRYFDFDKVESAVQMFENASIDEIKIPAFSAPNLEEGYRMFYNFNTSNLVDLSYVSMPKLTGINEMFASSNLQDLRFTGLNIQSAEDGYGAFLNAKMNDFYWTNSTAESLHDLNQMFRNVQAKNIDLSGNHFPTFRNGYGMFTEAKANKIDLDDFVIADNLIDPSGWGSDPQFNQVFMNANVNEITMVNAELHNLQESGGHGMFQGLNADKITIKDSVISGNSGYNGSLNSSFKDSNINHVDIESVEFNHIHNAALMFENANIDSLNIRDVSIPKVTNIYGMFKDLKSEISISIDSFSIGEHQSTVEMTGMFLGTDGNNVSIEDFTAMGMDNSHGLFKDSDISNLMINNINISGANGMAQANEWFSNSAIEDLSLENIELPDTKSLHGFFKDSTIDKLHIANFDTSNVDHMPEMFNGAEIPEVDFTQFDTSNVWSMGGMFNGAIMNNIDLSSFDLSSLEDVGGIFSRAETESIHMPNLTGEKLNKAEGMFRFANVKTIDISGLDTSLANLQPDELDPDSTSILYRMFGDSNIETVYVKSLEDIERLKSDGFDTQFTDDIIFEVK